MSREARYVARPSDRQKAKQNQSHVGRPSGRQKTKQHQITWSD